MADRITSNLDSKVRHALIRIYIKQLLPLKLANLMVALLLIYAIQHPDNIILLAGWFSLHLFFMALELSISYVFKQRHLKFKDRTWLLILSLPTILVGALWGAAVPLFLDASNPVNVVIITVLLLGMLSGSLYTLSLLPPLFYLFASAVMIPYALTLYVDQRFLPMIVASLGLGLFFAWLSHQLFRITYDLLLSRYKNKALAHKLKQTKHTAEQASAAKTRFLASASHDIRQPLQAIGLYAEALSHRLNETHNIESITALKKAHESMSNIMNSLLDISKLDAAVIETNITPLSMQAMVHRLSQDYQLSANKTGTHMRLRIADLYVHSDTVLLERIIRNLISNAIRYADQGEILLACRRRGEQVIFDVWDTGRGIPLNQQQKIFHEFYQLNNPERDQQKGMGLGLAIVQRLTHLLPGHRIELCSRLHQGSRFRLFLPAAEATTSISSIEQRIRQVDRIQGLQLLVIEDDPDVRQAMVAMMQLWGCQMIAAASAAEAMTTLQDKQPPDAIIADYRLPGEQTGVQAVAAIRKHIKQHIPALIITGESLPHSLQDIQAADVLLLHKPVMPNKIRMFLQRCIDA